MRSFATILLAALAGSSGAFAQTDIPVAQPASTPATPPTAQPVDQPPVAQPDNSQPPSGLVVVNPAAEQFDAALAAYTAGRYADAITTFSSFIASFPQDRRREEALYRLAESYRSLGRTDDALAAYTYLVQNYPDGSLRLNGELRRGAILFDSGKFTEAITPLQLVSTKATGEVQQAANDLLGRCYLATQKEPDGRALLQGLVDQQPPGKYSGDAAQALAELDDSQSKWADALALWQKVIALSTDPTIQAVAAARGGWSAIEAKQTDVAEKLFQISRKLGGSPDSRKLANTGLLRILFQKKHYTDWLSVYNDASKPSPSELLDNAREETLYDLGHVQFSLKHWKESVSAFDAYLAAFPAQDASVTAAYERFLALAQIDPTQIPANAEAYLKAWPQSPYRARVQLLEAQELSHEKKFSDALPLWESLAKEPAGDNWPHQDILLQLARTYDTLNNFPKAATAYQAYLDDLSTHPVSKGEAQTRLIVPVQARLAVCLQKSNQLLAATDAWKTVQSLAPAGSPERQMALESLGLIYARGGPAQAADLVSTFQALLKDYPQSSLAPLAAFTVGDSLFRNRDYAGAEPLLLKARNGDAKTWMQPATQRLVLGAFGLKDYDKTVAYLKEYDTLPIPSDPQAQLSMRLPAALFYWLAEAARKAGDWANAEIYYSRVTQHPDPGELLAGAWWQLGEVQSQRKEWTAAIASYQKYRQLKPDAKDATTVLLALGRAQLGAKNYDAAKDLGNQALLQEPEGPNSAASRMLLGETAFAAGNYAEAARMFGTLAVLFDSPPLGPQAMFRAAESYEKAGDAKSAAQWRQKLQDKYPQFQPTPYL